MFKRLLPLAVATFAVGTDAFVIAGLLPAISPSLEVSVPVAGQLITAYALTYAVSAPILGALTATLDRRVTLQLALAVFVAGNVVTAVATDYDIALLSRIITGLGAGLITPSATAAAAAMAPPHRRGRALAIVMGGLTVATAAGVPLGTLIGGFDWRLTLWSVAGLGAIAAIGVQIWLPQLRLPSASLRDRLLPLRNRSVLALLSVTLLSLTGTYVLYTYLGTALMGATGGSAAWLTVVLLVYGLGSLAATTTAGPLTDRFPAKRVLTGGLIASCVMLAISPFVMTSLVGASIWATVWAAAGWLTVIPQQHRLIALAPQSAPVLLGLNSSAIYAGTALGGTIGGISQTWLPVTELGLVGGVLMLAALLVATATPHETTAEVATPAAEPVAR